MIHGGSTVEAGGSGRAGIMALWNPGTLEPRGHGQCFGVGAVP